MLLLCQLKSCILRDIGRTPIGVKIRQTSGRCKIKLTVSSRRAQYTIHSLDLARRLCVSAIKWRFTIEYSVPERPTVSLFYLYLEKTYYTAGQFSCMWVGTGQPIPDVGLHRQRVRAPRDQQVCFFRFLT